MTIWEWSGCAGTADIEVKVGVVGLLWLSLEREIPDVVVLAAFVEKDSFPVVWKKFDICSFKMLVIIILIGIKLFNELRRYAFIGVLCCLLAEFIETVKLLRKKITLTREICNF